MAAKPLIVPVETQVREFDAKLLLCCVAAERGLTSHLGFQNRIRNRITSFPPGILIAKGFAARKATMLDLMCRLGHRVWAWDEEGLVHAPPHVYHDRRMGRGSLERLSGIFSWGEDYSRMVRAYPEWDDTPIHETGNPRIDLLRPDVRSFYDETVAGIRERFGPFVLVNSSFGTSNAAVTQSERARGTAPHLAASAAYWVAQLEFRNRVFSLFREMVSELAAAFPERTILVRPHPSEGLALWSRLVEAHDNLRLASEGNVVPWIMASEVMIHSGCMTAVEAVLLDRLPLAYRPILSEDFDRPLPNALSRECFTLDELLSATAEQLEKSPPAEEILRRRRRLEGFIDLEDPRLCSERIVDVLEPVAKGDAGWEHPARTDYLHGWIAAHARGLGKWARSFRRDDVYATWHQRQHFPEIPLQEVERRIDALRRALGRFRDVRVRPFLQDVFAIDRAP